jgi:hypothetical protein
MAGSSCETSKVWNSGTAAQRVSFRDLTVDWWIEDGSLSPLQVTCNVRHLQFAAFARTKTLYCSISCLQLHQLKARPQGSNLLKKLSSHLYQSTCNHALRDPLQRLRNVTFARYLGPNGRLAHMSYPNSADIRFCTSVGSSRTACLSPTRLNSRYGTKHQRVLQCLQDKSKSRRYLHRFGPLQGLEMDPGIRLFSPSDVLEHPPCERS